MARLEEIFDAELGSSEDDELAVLLDLVECYEDRRYRMEFRTTYRQTNGIFRKTIRHFIEASS